MKYIERRKKYNVIAISMFLILTVIILTVGIFHKESIEREIELLGIVYTEDGEVNQNVVNEFLKEDSDKNYYEAGQKVLEETGYAKSGRKMLSAHFPAVVYVLVGIIFGIVIFLIYYLNKATKINRQYQDELLEWIDTKEQNSFTVYEETRLLLEKIEEVKKLNREKEKLLVKEKESVLRFMEDISHQLKTPLAIMRLSCERELRESPQLEEMMQNYMVQIDKMSLLIHNLLQTGRLESGKVQMTHEEVYLDEFKETILYDLEEIALEKNIALDFSGCTDQIWYFDLNWMKEAVENVMKNGLEHGKEGSVLKIHFAKEVRDYCIRISNTGSNIDKEKLESLFERFVTSDEGKESSGLGLSIAKLIVQSHFGTIQVKNNKKDGVLFEIVFPDFKY